MLDAVVSFMWPEGMARQTYIGDDIGVSRPPDARELVFETRDGYMTAGTVAPGRWSARTGSRTGASSPRRAW
jgi:hypothetical protein